MQCLACGSEWHCYSAIVAAKYCRATTSPFCIPIFHTDLKVSCLQTARFAARVFNPEFFSPLNLTSMPSFGVADHMPDLFTDLKLATLVSQALPGLGDNISTVGEHLSRSAYGCLHRSGCLLSLAVATPSTLLLNSGGSPYAALSATTTPHYGELSWPSSWKHSSDTRHR